jgi:hypothetical protein
MIDLMIDEQYNEYEIDNPNIDAVLAVPIPSMHDRSSRFETSKFQFTAIPTTYDGYPKPPSPRNILYIPYSIASVYAIDR